MNHEQRVLTDSSPVTRTLLLLASEAIILVGASIEALLLGRLVITYGLTTLPTAWPQLLGQIARGLLWPWARLVGQTPETAPSAMILLAMAIYLALTVAAFGGLRLFIRHRLTIPLRPPEPRSARSGY